MPTPSPSAARGDDRARRRAARPARSRSGCRHRRRRRARPDAAGWGCRAAARAAPPTPDRARRRACAPRRRASRLSVCKRLGGLDVAVTPESSDLLGDRVHPCPDGVTAPGDVEEPGVEPSGLVDLVEQRRTATPRQCRPDAVEVGAQEPLIDHANERYRATLDRCRSVRTTGRRERRAPGRTRARRRRWSAARPESVVVVAGELGVGDRDRHAGSCRRSRRGSRRRSA